MLAVTDAGKRRLFFERELKGANDELASAEQALKRLRPVFDPKKPTALFVGRYQPFHQGHRALIAEGIKRVGQACVAVRNTQGTDD